MRRWKWSLFAAAIIVGLIFVVSVAMRPTHDSLVRSIRLALAERNPGRAEQLVLTTLKRFDSQPGSWLIAGEVAARSGRWQESLDRYDRVVTDQRTMQVEAAYGRGEACVQLGKFERAEREFRAALEIDSDAAPALRRLVDILIFTGRRHGAAPWLERVITTPSGSLNDLFHLGDLDHMVSQPASVWAATKAPDADLSLVLGAGLQALTDGRYEQAARHFDRVLAARPADPDAQAGRGQALLQTNPAQLSSWRAQLPPEVSQDAGVLALLGHLADQEQRPRDAAQLFAQVVKRRPTSRVAWHQLGLSLRRTGHVADAELALERSLQLQELGTWLNDLFGQRQNLGLVRRITERVAKMGRVGEATAWTRHALTVSPNEAWALRLRDRLQQSPATIVDQDREQKLQSLLDKFGPTEPTATNPRSEDSIRSTGVPGASDGISSAQDRVATSQAIRFVDVADEVGLRFVYRSARDERTPGARIIETIGGGVGVIDYDCDGWPDLYFTQGSREFPCPENNPDLDCLFRNHEGQNWSEVSKQAGLGDVGFGQGVAVGDINNDGFPDLYVANYGFNVLYQNQGDGTFQDVTPPELRQQKVWTSSCLIADLNGDGWPDLFDVTYCRGEDVETRLCGTPDAARSCSPRVFSAADDRLWLGTGDGGWKSANQGLDLPLGLGLGLVAFRTNSESPLGLFIANDETPNFWLNNVQMQRGAMPLWEDRALIGGLAVDADGQSQACMGIACDDANGDGFPDLFVTNFYHESNTLYLAAGQDFFEDRTRSFQLAQPSWDMLGFGTQFVDADLDGWPDLLVANGHIDDLSATGVPFQMPLQFFHNRVQHFQELHSSEAGGCFAKPALGRGMARLDWNRDGQEEAVVVNQESPAMLLKNVSETPGKSLVLQFRALDEARDAVGTIVRIKVGSRILTRQLTAGDGFQASNERQLVIGTETVQSVDSIEVLWPNGAKQEIGPLPTGKRYLILQGRNVVRMDN